MSRSAAGTARTVWSARPAWLVLLTAGVSAAALLGPVSPAAAAPAQVPCAATGGGHVACSWYVAGDGRSGGAPVLSGAGAPVGFLHRGSNWVICQRVGRQERSGPYFNVNWAWTQADDGQWGWVNAVWASGGDNDGGFAGVPACGASHGAPPSGTSTPAPAAPAPGPAAAPPAGSVLPTPVAMGSYGTYSLRYQLWRSSTARRRWNFTDWTATQMMSQLNSNFSRYFTFTGCGRHLAVGQRCRLDTTLSPDGPVEVIAVSASGFALRSLKGHPEGAGRTIRFEFQRYVNAAEVSSMSLTVQAWGPLGGSSLLGALNSKGIASTSWSIFERNIRNRFPDAPPGGVCTPTFCEV